MLLPQIVPTGNGTPRHPLFFIHWMWKDKSNKVGGMREARRVWKEEEKRNKGGCQVLPNVFAVDVEE